DFSLSLIAISGFQMNTPLLTGRCCSPQSTDRAVPGSTLRTDVGGYQAGLVGRFSHPAGQVPS
ncbi:hypothetical protein, partial [Pseudomonas aeruginosa]|uniref:hypothetical protein n=1 Tax=Pseudomonas aeruginosa TaxID=287 RepID=UPI003CF4138F